MNITLQNVQEVDTGKIMLYEVDSLDISDVLTGPARKAQARANMGRVRARAIAASGIVDTMSTVIGDSDVNRLTEIVDLRDEGDQFVVLVLVKPDKRGGEELRSIAEQMDEDFIEEQTGKTPMELTEDELEEVIFQQDFGRMFGSDN